MQLRAATALANAHAATGSICFSIVANKNAASNESPAPVVSTTSTLYDGTAFPAGADHTCSNWTSNGAEGSAQVGHHDRTGGGDNPTSWNSAHGSRGCSQENLRGTGGDGLFYCFAAN